MAYSDPEKRRNIQRQRWAQRRADWFMGKVCELCGATEELELDHIDPDTKVSHRIWSWSQARREAELAKCRPLCRRCHRIKTNTEIARGERIGISKLTEEKVRAIRTSASSHRQLARLYSVD